MFIPDPGWSSRIRIRILIFFFTHSGYLILDPGVKMAPDSGSATLPSPSAHNCCTPTRTTWVWGWPATTMSSTPTSMTARSSALPFTKRQAAVFYLCILCNLQFTYRCWFLNFSPQRAVWSRFPGFTPSNGRCNGLLPIEGGGGRYEVNTLCTAGGRRKNTRCIYKKNPLQGLLEGGFLENRDFF